MQRPFTLKIPVNGFCLFILIGLIILAGCDKRDAKKLFGTYKCEVTSHSWGMNQSSAYTTYTKEVNVNLDGKFVKIFSYSIHIDKLRDENIYSEPVGHSTFQVQFKNDSIYIKESY